MARQIVWFAAAPPLAALYSATCSVLFVPWSKKSVKFLYFPLVTSALLDMVLCLTVEQGKKCFEFSFRMPNHQVDLS